MTTQILNVGGMSVMSSVREELGNYKYMAEVREEGFTLIELLMVLLIIGILMAIAIPTFLSTTASATRTSSQANLQTALTAADAYFTEANQTYQGIDSTNNDSSISNISALATGMNFVSGSSSTGIDSVSLWTDNSNSVVLASYSAGTQDCWYVIDLKAPSASVWGGLTTGTYYAVDKGVGTAACIAKGTIPRGATTPQTGGFPAG
jgi:type IV pilus assembly protein PilA